MSVITPVVAARTGAGTPRIRVIGHKCLAPCLRSTQDCRERASPQRDRPVRRHVTVPGQQPPLSSRVGSGTAVRLQDPPARLAEGAVLPACRHWAGWPTLRRFMGRCFNSMPDGRPSRASWGLPQRRSGVSPNSALRRDDPTRLSSEARRRGVTDCGQRSYLSGGYASVGSKISARTARARSTSAFSSRGTAPHPRPAALMNGPDGGHRARRR